MAKVVMDSQEPMHISQGWRWHIKTRIKRSSVELVMGKGWTLRRAWVKRQDQGIIICRHLWINIIKRICFQPITDMRYNPESRELRNVIVKEDPSHNQMQKIILIWNCKAKNPRTEKRTKRFNKKMGWRKIRILDYDSLIYF